MGLIFQNWFKFKNILGKLGDFAQNWADQRSVYEWVTFSWQMQLAASAMMMQPGTHHVSYASNTMAKYCSTLNIEKKDSEKNPFTQNVNKHNVEKLSLGAELQFCYTFFLCFVNPDWKYNLYLQNITCKNHHFHLTVLIHVPLNGTRPVRLIMEKEIRISPFSMD